MTKDVLFVMGTGRERKLNAAIPGENFPREADPTDGYPRPQPFAVDRRTGAAVRLKAHP
jgi:hypothetical protein